jgi:hypothetical protein
MLRSGWCPLLMASRTLRAYLRAVKMVGCADVHYVNLAVLRKFLQGTISARQMESGPSDLAPFRRTAEHTH